MRLLFAFLFICLNLSFLQAQEPEVYENKIYKNNLRTVQFHLNNSPISYPIVNLNARDNALQLYFDDVENDVKDYTYTIQLCDKDWTAANLSEMDYLEGFTEADIRDFDFSQRVQTNFIHYSVTFPNQDIRWTKSGNYILKVYEDMGSEKELVITRRFMVIESLGKIQENIAYPSRTDLQQTHQEIDFKLLLNQGVEIQNPIKEISATVLQNGRWDNAIMNIQPMLYRGNSISFDYQNKIIFPAGKEWRPLDIRSFNQRSAQVAEIVELEDGVDLILKIDKKRTYKAHHSKIDINGRYVIQNFDLPQRIQQSNGILNLGNNNDTEDTTDDIFNSSDFTEEDKLQSDYALVYFTLDSPTEYDDGELYVFGGLTDWEIHPEFKLEYDRKDFVYRTEAWLKQGFYDYMYAFVPDENPTKIDLETLEGNWYETNNQYTIIIYYRPAGERYDRIISVWHPRTAR